MARIILKMPYIKGGSGAANYAGYMATREGVDVSANAFVLDGPVTAKQTDFIQQLVTQISDAKECFEYEVYMKSQTKKNASELITFLCEQNPELFQNPEMYMNYIAMRPNAERIAEHGLFGSADKIDLDQIKEEIAAYKGNIWMPIISLRREDAERLGYHNATAWKNLVRSKQLEMAEALGIPPSHLHWYGSFHNEGHHPHIHLLLYSAVAGEAYVNKEQIQALKDSFAKTIFKDDLYHLYNEKTASREKVSQETKDCIAGFAEKIRENDYENSPVCEKLMKLAEELKAVTGKKVYGYLPKELKQLTNDIVREIAKDETVTLLYDAWCGVQDRIIGMYKNEVLEHPFLWENKEFKKIKNAVVAEAVKLGDDSFYFEDDSESEEEPLPEPEFNIEPVNFETAEPEFNTEPMKLETAEPDISKAVYCEYNSSYKQARYQLYHEKNYKLAFELLTAETRNGNIPAFFDLGKMYQSGLYVDQDEEKANGYLNEALDGYITLEAQESSDFYEYQIGRLYALKTNFQDYTQAKEWFELAAGKGNVYAMFSLGNLHYYGNGTPVNYETAYDYFKESADKDCLYSYYKLGYMLRKGIGCKADEARSDHYFSRMIAGSAMTIKKEDALNCYRLGQLYEKGWGTQSDIPKAMQYYHSAAESNNANSEFALGRLYFYQGDDENGEYYINRAIEHGNTYAKEWLEKRNEWQDHRQPIAPMVLHLFCRLADMLEDDANRKIDGHNKSIVDSKTRKEILRRKLSLGLRLE